MVASLRYVIGSVGCLNEEAAGRLLEVAEQMKEMLTHYRTVLVVNHIELSFRD
jgi:hypothetical protein